MDGVILAAGTSRRAGTHKMMLDVGGRTMVEACAQTMLRFCRRVVVVGGYRIGDVARVLAGYSGVEIVFNPDYPSGMFSSVRQGVGHVRAGRFFLSPGDCPFVTAEVYRRLLNSRGEIAVPVFEGQNGHPVLMRARLIPDLLGGGHATLRDFIRLKGFDAVPVEDPGIHLDIDTVDDYRRAMETHCRAGRESARP